MADARADLVQRCLDALGRGDLDAAWACMDPDVEVDWSASRGTDAGVHRGGASVRAFWLSYLEVFDDVVFVTEEIFDRGDTLLLAMRAAFRRADGANAETRFALAVEFRGELILRWRLHQDVAEALAAVEEEEGGAD